MEPTPEERKARAAAVFGRSADAYDTVIPFFGTFAAHLVDRAGIGPGDDVLDVACGSGAVLLRAAARGRRAVGVDLAPEMVDRSRDAASEAGLRNVEVRIGDAERLEEPDGSFDVVTCGFGIFFCPHPDVALAEAHRVLRPGGRYAATTFTNRSGGYPWLREVAESLGHQSGPPPSPVVSSDGLVTALRAAGFTNVEVTGVEERFVFRDVDAYVAWNWSHGGRTFLETLDDAAMDRFRELVGERLEQHAVDDGYELIQAVDITVAQR